MTPNDVATTIAGSQTTGSINLPSFNSSMGGQDFYQWDT